MEDFKIPMEAKVEDKITGFVGTVTGRVEYVTGCRQYLVTPRIKPDGDFVTPHWFDEDRLVVKAPATAPLEVERPGPDAPAPVK